MPATSPGRHCPSTVAGPRDDRRAATNRNGAGMTRDKIIGAADAVEVVLSGDTVVTGGFVGIGFPEHLAKALEQRFLANGEPSTLTLIFAAGQGDGRTRGLNHFGHPGMVGRAIGGHWGLVPTLGALA